VGGSPGDHRTPQAGRQSVLVAEAVLERHRCADVAGREVAGGHVGVAGFHRHDREVDVQPGPVGRRRRSRLDRVDADHPEPAVAHRRDVWVTPHEYDVVVAVQQRAEQASQTSGPEDGDPHRIRIRRRQV